MTEREKMLSGALYDASDPDLSADRRRCRDLLHRLNHGRPDDDARSRILAELLGDCGEALWIEPPFYCDYGANIHVGDRVYFNFGCTVLDPAEVRIGNDVLFGPQVQLYTATHPVDWRERRTQKEAARPITIGSDVWIGGAAVLLPGVTVGDRSVVGAGAVVTRDVPPGVFAAGNPCRVLRTLD